MAQLIRLCLPWCWLLLWSQSVAQTNCLLSFLLMLPVLALIALHMLEAALLRRRALVGMYLREATPLYRLLRGGLLLMIWQAFKALVFSFILLVEAIDLPLWIWGLLLLDNLLLYLGYRWLLKRFSAQVKAHALPAIARQALVLINTLLLTLIITTGYFFTPHPDYRDLTWQQAAAYEAEQLEVGCEVLAPAVRLAVTKDTVAWWLAETWSDRLHKAGHLLTIAGWFLFLFTTTLFLWAYSRLTLGMLIQPLELFLHRGQPQADVGHGHSRT